MKEKAAEPNSLRKQLQRSFLPQLYKAVLDLDDVNPGWDQAREEDAHKRFSKSLSMPTITATAAGGGATETVAVAAAAAAASSSSSSSASALFPQSEGSWTNSAPLARSSTFNGEKYNRTDFKFRRTNFFSPVCCCCCYCSTINNRRNNYSIRPSCPAGPNQLSKESSCDG